MSQGSPKKMMNALPTSVLGKIRSSTPDKIQPKDGNSSAVDKNLSDLPISPLYLTNSFLKPDVSVKATFPAASSYHKSASSIVLNKIGSKNGGGKLASGTIKRHEFDDISDDEFTITDGKDNKKMPYEEISDEDFDIKDANKKDALEKNDTLKLNTAKDLKKKRDAKEKVEGSDGEQSDPEIKKEVELFKKRLGYDFTFCNYF